MDNITVERTGGVINQTRNSLTNFLYTHLPTSPWFYLGVSFAFFSTIAYVLLSTFWTPILKLSYFAGLLVLTAVSAYPGRLNPMDITLEFRNSFILVVSAIFGPWTGLAFGFVASVVNEVSAMIKKVPESMADVVLYTAAGFVLGTMKITQANLFSVGLLAAVIIIVLKAIIYSASSTRHEIAFYCVFTLIWIVMDLMIIAPWVYTLMLPIKSL